MNLLPASLLARLGRSRKLKAYRRARAAAGRQGPRGSARAAGGRAGPGAAEGSARWRADAQRPGAR